jgi:hypothetical protein
MGSNSKSQAEPMMLWLHSLPASPVLTQGVTRRISSLLSSSPHIPQSLHPNFPPQQHCDAVPASSTLAALKFVNLYLGPKLQLQHLYLCSLFQGFSQASRPSSRGTW